VAPTAAGAAAFALWAGQARRANAAIVSMTARALTVTFDAYRNNVLVLST
jgi:hypothetical protein